MLIHRLRAALAFIKLTSLRQDRLIVLPNLYWVKAIFLGNFIQRLQAADSFESNLAFESVRDSNARTATPRRPSPNVFIIRASTEERS